MRLRYRFPGEEWRTTAYTAERYSGLWRGGAEIHIIAD